MSAIAHFTLGNIAKIKRRSHVPVVGGEKRVVALANVTSNEAIILIATSKMANVAVVTITISLKTKLPAYHAIATTRDQLMALAISSQVSVSAEKESLEDVVILAQMLMLK